MQESLMRSFSQSGDCILISLKSLTRQNFLLKGGFSLSYKFTYVHALNVNFTGENMSLSSQFFSAA